jgi:hypothetical protein
VKHSAKKPSASRLPRPDIKRVCIFRTPPSAREAGVNLSCRPSAREAGVNLSYRQHNKRPATDHAVTGRSRMKQELGKADMAFFGAKVCF